MITRILELPRDYNILLFGPRGSGKSTLIGAYFDPATTYRIDLLKPSVEQEYALDPEQLVHVVAALPQTVTHVIIDEVQKVPKLLDVVHGLIESANPKYFILTGSSARKLKRGAANLLAGRAFVYHLYPFSYLEQLDSFKLSEVLQYGQLPRVLKFTNSSSKARFLQTYVNTYLKEEVAAEQLVKKLVPFRRFLDVAAQSNGKIVNFSNIAKDTGVSDNTIREYFSILEDTLIGFFLEPYSGSFRKRLGQTPKFYLFDLGVARSLTRTLSVPLLSQTNAYGDAFEHFIILEVYRLVSYSFPEYRLSYLHTKDGEEIDLVIERPGLPLLCIEIKSTTSLDEDDLAKTSSLVSELPGCEAVCFYNGSIEKQFKLIRAIPWAEGIKRFFG
jgi:predicted AAA+ superfamily ATPase